MEKRHECINRNANEIGTNAPVMRIGPVLLTIWAVLILDITVHGVGSKNNHLQSTES